MPANIVCHCVGVNSKDIMKECCRGNNSLMALKQNLNVAVTCKQCIPEIECMLDDFKAEIPLQ
jgi:bacterioferritin-associated ferredoxin